MNFARALCFFGRHDLTAWRKVSPPAFVVGTVVVPSNQRHCKRTGCKYAEVKTVRITKPRVRRPANAADTVQGEVK